MVTNSDQRRAAREQAERKRTPVKNKLPPTPKELDTND